MARTMSRILLLLPLLALARCRGGGGEGRREEREEGGRKGGGGGIGEDPHTNMSRGGGKDRIGWVRIG